ncbi:ubiquitin-conjugating enzyme E2 W [Puccinia sorghi]|uniref:Ubiquitin-conjugating enzyme E2 W n=1 Tax=Puccinia sorghi TaxID=27349 RepID=A0A0L6VBZ3_9BASI|nr:ubiquitin-conjugating enzyme E2 W [Puccinia sorghi]
MRFRPAEAAPPHKSLRRAACRRAPPTSDKEGLHQVRPAAFGPPESLRSPSTLSYSTLNGSHFHQKIDQGRLPQLVRHQNAQPETSHADFQPQELSDLQDGGCPVGCSLVQADDETKLLRSLFDSIATKLHSSSSGRLKLLAHRKRSTRTRNFCSVSDSLVFIDLSCFSSPQYPIEAPEVVFVVSPTNPPGQPEQQAQEATWAAPEHPHVYVGTSFNTTSRSNGHICASILSTGWSPVLNCAAICLTIQSMLASCKKKERPIDNDRYVRNAPISPKASHPSSNTRWHFDDDTV